MSIVETGRWCWTAGGIVVSALLYLLDFATNIQTLQVYYHYDYQCQQANDSICLRLTHNVNNYASAFGVSLALLVTAHFSYSIIFWFTLPRKEHPLRLAYFLPIIQLSRLVKLLWRSTSCSNEGIQGLLKGKEEANNLYDVLGASLETSPQLILQFHIAMVFGIYSASDEGAVPIPRILIISMVVAIVSGIYNGSKALLYFSEGITIASKVSIAIAGGLHTAATMVAHTTMVSSLLTAYHSGRWIIPYAFVSFVIPWIFFQCVMGLHNQKTTCKLRLVQSFALAHVSMFIGPMYATVRLFKRSNHIPRILILASLMQAVIWVIGIAGVLTLANHLPFSGVPCRRFAWKGHNDNKYLTCHSFFGTLSITFVLHFLSSFIFIFAYRTEKDEVPPQTPSMDRNIDLLNITPTTCTLVSDPENPIPL